MLNYFYICSKVISGKDYVHEEENNCCVKSNFFFSTFKKFSFQPISAACIQHKVGHFCYSL